MSDFITEARRATESHFTHIAILNLIAYAEEMEKELAKMRGIVQEILEFNRAVCGGGGDVAIGWNECLTAIQGWVKIELDKK